MKILSFYLISNRCFLSQLCAACCETFVRISGDLARITSINAEKPRHLHQLMSRSRGAGPSSKETSGSRVINTRRIKVIKRLRAGQNYVALITIGVVE